MTVPIPPTTLIPPPVAVPVQPVLIGISKTQHPGGLVGWFDDHVFPDLREALVLAKKIEPVLPKIGNDLPALLTAIRADPAIAEKLMAYLPAVEEIVAAIVAL